MFSPRIPEFVTVVVIFVLLPVFTGYLARRKGRTFLKWMLTELALVFLASVVFGVGTALVMPGMVNDDITTMGKVGLAVTLLAGVAVLAAGPIAASRRGVGGAK